MSYDLTKLTCDYRYLRIIDTEGKRICKSSDGQKINAYDCYNSILSGFLTENPDHPIMIAIVCAPYRALFDSKRDYPLCVSMFNQVLGGMDNPNKPQDDHIPYYTNKDMTFYWVKYEGNDPLAFDARDVNAIIKESLLNFWLNYQRIDDDDQDKVRTCFDAICYAPTNNTAQFATCLEKILTPALPASRLQRWFSTFFQPPTPTVKSPKHRLRFILWLPDNCFDQLCNNKTIGELFPFVDRIIYLKQRLADSDQTKLVKYAANDQDILRGIIKEARENNLDSFRCILKEESENYPFKEKNTNKFTNELSEQIK